MFSHKNINQFLASNAHRILALMLLSLHTFLLWDEADKNLSHAIFLCHYGLFLMWQPIWRSSEKLSIPSAVVFFAFAWLTFTFVNWWVTALWLAILLGLLGGRIFAEEAKPNRVIHILAASYLLAMLLLWVVPKLLGASADLEAATFTITYLMPILPIAILFLSTQAVKTSQLPILDFFYTLIITLIAIIMILASYAIGSQNQVNYIEVMFITIFAIALSLIALSFLWKPSARFSGVELLMSRYLSSVGMPFEKWVRNISNLGEIELNPESFLKGAMQEMSMLPWVTGVSWLADNTAGEIGKTSEHATGFNFKDLNMTLHSRWKISPALYVHVRLLTQIMGEFYEAKRREETLRQNAYMQAFYESGSRLTHDIKNILQSVGTLVTAAEQTKNKDSEALLDLIRRQLPLLNQRIAATLDKLKAPGEEKKRLDKISAWWSALQMRHQLSDIQFNAESLPALDINAEVLDSVIDNLISNASEKAKYQSGTHISVTIYDNNESGFCIDVIDTGDPVDSGIAKHLFKKHISSQNGMGVGLYHAAYDAKQAGYELSLANNKNQAVCFRLALNSNAA
ncbi:MAG: HAMP domain-containing sensor histidine kinase [Methylophilaceae bacterium]